MNICKNCVFWQSCMQYRYRNIERDYMEEIYKKPNSDGDLVIYVQKCNRYIKFKPFKGPIF